MKILQFAISAIEMTLAITLGFSCALGLATLWLKGMLASITKHSG